MPDVCVIQLSDLHFGAGKANPHPVGRLANDVSALIKTFPNAVVLVSGDITYKGSHHGYEEAAQFFEKVMGDTGLSRDRFLFCPGNHDCHVESKFDGFDTFTYRIRRDRACSFTDKPCQIVDIAGLTFVLLNSAQHLEYGYGLVDTKALAKAVLRDAANTVAVTHHHLIPTHEGDSSTTRNAYDLLACLDEHRIPVLLHGHQHMTKGLPIGRTPVHVIGVNSFNFAYAGGQNALGVLEWKDDAITYSRHLYLNDGFGTGASRFARQDHMEIK